MRLFSTSFLLLALSLPAAAQVLAPPDLVASWRAEGNANDAVGGNHGTLLEGAGFAAGFVGQAFRLDGVDDWVSVSNTPVLAIPVEIDIKPGSFPNSISLGSNGTVPVAILSSSSLDAATIGPSTVALAVPQSTY